MSYAQILSAYSKRQTSVLPEAIWTKEVSWVRAGPFSTMPARVPEKRMGKSSNRRFHRGQTARQMLKALQDARYGMTSVAKRLLRRCIKAERRLEEANRGRVRPVTNIVVGGTCNLRKGHRWPVPPGGSSCHDKGRPGAVPGFWSQKPGGDG